MEKIKQLLAQWTAERRATHEQIDAERKERRENLQAEQKDMERQKQQVNRSLEELSRKKNSTVPTQEEVELERNKMIVLFRWLVLLSFLEAANAALGITAFSESLIVLILFTPVIVGTVGWSGDLYHDSTAAWKEKAEPDFWDYLQVVSTFLLHFVICLFVAVLTAVRIWKLHEAWQLQQVEAGMSSTESVLAGNILMIVGGMFSFVLSWCLGILWHRWKRSVDNWMPWVRLYRKKDYVESRPGYIDAELNSLDDNFRARHKGAETECEKRLTRLVKKIERKGMLYKFFSRRTYPGLHDLSEFHKDGFRGAWWNGAAVFLIGLSLSLTSGCGFITKDASAFFQGNKKKVVHHFIMVDPTRSCSWPETEGKFGEKIMRLVIRSGGGKDKFSLLAIDGGMKASPQILYHATLPSDGIIFQNELRIARIGIRNKLKTGMESLVGVRDSSFWWRTEIIYSLLFVSSKMDSTEETRIWIASDMVEDSDLFNLKVLGKKFDNRKLIEKLRSQSLIPNLKGGKVFVVTPAVSMKDADAELKRRDFWLEFFRESNVSEKIWFGPDYVSVEGYLNHLINSN